MRRPHPTRRALSLALLFALFPFAASAQTPNAWVNELHYDNVGGDADEFVEVIIEDAGSVDLRRFQVLHYNGADGDPDAAAPVALNEFTAGAAVGGFSLYSYNYTDNGETLQNGTEALALCFDSNDDGTFDALLASGGTDQFLSYEGTLTGTTGAGCAGGETSTQIGADESPPSPVGESVQLEGSGTSYSDFAWTGPLPSTPGAVNTGQTLGGGPITVDDDGPADYASIQAAIDAADAGATIEVRDGLYAEDLTVDKTLTLEGANAALPSGAPRGDEATIEGQVIVSASEVVVNGFKMTGGTPSANPNATVGLFLQPGTSGHTIANNELTGPGAGGEVRGLVTSTGPVTDVTIRHNGVSGWTSGLFLNPGAEAFSIEGNEIRDNTTGIEASDVGPDVTAAQNCITGNATAGIEASGGHILTATSNYWGAASGPGGTYPGSGDAVLGPVTVDFSPEPVAACPSGDPTPDCEATTLSESVTPPEGRDPGVVTATFANADGLEEIEYTRLDNFTVTGEPDGFTRNGDTWTADDPQDPPTTAGFDLTQATIGDPSTYFAIAASTCPTQDDGQLEVNFDPIHELSPEAPAAMQFAGNAPNPFGDRTTIEFALPRPTTVTLTVYDTMGRRVATLADGAQRAGTHRIDWDGRTGTGHALASGVYLLRLTTDKQTFTRRMTLIR
ncbi:FlgD immunoglobulin-like domain containing protein [Salinibacter altiplanensis]|uniref:FlgD immunoglobulin-like domain containing protein n=1 Tax=Salinibacter altiplanensis TaxID=1803181 RepID=UPI0013000379|nr:right-handed parallel beta-helix repeat-containing protein [Salinibacter altiplanensis]